MKPVITARQALLNGLDTTRQMDRLSFPLTALLARILQLEARAADQVPQTGRITKKMIQVERLTQLHLERFGGCSGQRIPDRFSNASSIRSSIFSPASVGGPQNSR